VASLPSAGRSSARARSQAPSYESSGLARFQKPGSDKYQQIRGVSGYTGFVPGWTQTFGNGVRTLCGKNYIDSVADARELRKWSVGV
jgi:hypothetical protein